MMTLVDPPEMTVGEEVEDFHDVKHVFSFIDNDIIRLCIKS